MRRLAEIRADIDRLSDERRELWRELGRQHDQSITDDLHRLDEQLAALWDEDRSTRAQLRFGDRETIVRRARAEERLERAA